MMFHIHFSILSLSFSITALLLHLILSEFYKTVVRKNFISDNKAVKMDDFGENFLDLQVEKELTEDPALLGYENSHNELLIEEDPSGLELEFQAAVKEL